MAPSIQDLIASVGERLTPTERRIAEAVLADPTLLAFGTVSDLAGRAETSRPSIVRFATKLGFGGYSDLQEWVRDGVSRQLFSPSQRIRQRGGEAESVRDTIEAAVQHVFGELQGDRVEALADPMIRAERVLIISGETSMAGARVLHSGLTMVRNGVHLVEEQAVGRALSGASPTDVGIVFDFARYRRSSVVAARALHELGVEIVAITDGPLSPLASLTKNWCQLIVPAVGPFDSSVPAVAAAEIIIAEVVRKLGAGARERVDRLEALWQRTGTYLEDADRSASEG